MKNKEINQITEEEYREAMASEDYDWFPMDPYDEDEGDPYTADRMLEDLYNETVVKYYERLKKEAEEEEYRRRFWQPEYDLSGDEIIRD